MTLDERNENPLRVLAISGSLRKASFNTGLVRAEREIAPEGMEITIFDIRDLPFYDGDVEAEGDPSEVAGRLKEELKLRVDVELVTPGTLASDAPRIVDERTWA